MLLEQRALLIALVSNTICGKIRTRTTKIFARFARAPPFRQLFIWNPPPPRQNPAAAPDTERQHACLCVCAWRRGGGGGGPQSVYLPPPPSDSQTTSPLTTGNVFRRIVQFILLERNFSVFSSASCGVGILENESFSFLSE